MKGNVLRLPGKVFYFPSRRRPASGLGVTGKKDSFLMDNLTDSLLGRLLDFHMFPAVYSNADMQCAESALQKCSKECFAPTLLRVPKKCSKEWFGLRLEASVHPLGTLVGLLLA